MTEGATDPLIGEVQQSQAPAVIQRYVAKCLRAGVLARLQSWRHPEEIRTVLDVGCGLGDWALQLGATSECVLALDINPRFIHAARAKAAAQGADNVSFVIGSFEDLAGWREDASFDLIVLGAVLFYADDADACRLLSETRRLLRPDGLVYVRASVSNLDHEQRSDGKNFAVYRIAARYERFFRDARLHVVGRWRSERLIMEGLTKLMPQPLRAAMAFFIAPLAWAAGFFQRATDPVGYQNWFLRP